MNDTARLGTIELSARMACIWIGVVLTLVFATGCSEESQDTFATGQLESENAREENATAGGSQITTRFGMTFCRVEVDSSRDDHHASFPASTYYLQQSEFAYEEFVAYCDAAVGDGPDRDARRSQFHFPSEWREVADLAVELSRLDADYDYVLPTQAQWTFACMNGNEQSCPGGGAKSTIDSTDSDRPNRFGIRGFMNYDAECANVPGLFLGKLGNWTGGYAGRNEPECRCDQFTTGNPDADDGLNELIVARYVVVPKSKFAGK